MKILVYPQNVQTNTLNLMNRLDEIGLTYLVDTEKLSLSWLKTNLDIGRLVDIDYKFWSLEDINNETCEISKLMCMLLPDSELSPQSWMNVRTSLMTNLEGFELVPIQKVVSQNEILHQQDLESGLINVEPKEYSLISLYEEDHDTMFYQVEKPFTDLPYTVVGIKYSDRWHLPFFSALFVVRSWGICAGDMDFLQQCWEHLKVPEHNYPPVLDAQSLVREHISMQEKDDSWRPLVYRKTIQEVIQMYKQNSWPT